IALLLKMMRGNRSASKKSAERRCASRFGSPVSIPFIRVDLEVRLLRRACVELQPTAELAESATNRAHHHVLDREVHLRVRRVDVPVHVCPLFRQWRTSCWYNQLVA